MLKKEFGALAREAAKTLKTEADVDALSGRFRKVLDEVMLNGEMGEGMCELFRY